MLTNRLSQPKRNRDPEADNGEDLEEVIEGMFPNKTFTCWRQSTGNPDTVLRYESSWSLIKQICWSDITTIPSSPELEVNGIRIRKNPHFAEFFLGGIFTFTSNTRLRIAVQKKKAV